MAPLQVHCVKWWSRLWMFNFRHWLAVKCLFVITAVSNTVVREQISLHVRTHARTHTHTQYYHWIWPALCRWVLRILIKCMPTAAARFCFFKTRVSAFKKKKFMFFSFPVFFPLWYNLHYNLYPRREREREREFSPYVHWCFVLTFGTRNGVWRTQKLMRICRRTRVQLLKDHSFKI